MSVCEVDRRYNSVQYCYSIRTHRTLAGRDRYGEIVVSIGRCNPGASTSIYSDRLLVETLDGHRLTLMRSILRNCYLTTSGI